MAQYKASIKSYSIIVVCGKFGYEGAIKEAASIIGSDPVASEKYFSDQIAKGAYELPDKL
jgi:hypothetical protein